MARRLFSRVILDLYVSDDDDDNAAMVTQGMANLLGVIMASDDKPKTVTGAVRVENDPTTLPDLRPLTPLEPTTTTTTTEGTHP